ncbi:MAG: 1-deoxy-D-xylulose-5-phosphate synthase [Thermoguttaceae bacterium]|nr:1-deoxy-D-xylulose-5-phosphate synthase [Thermoguttaceae bacterium]MDW8077920.1 1-deoxy-D-xylulose-5-phosphate synthase [Thermoguttaceae bacterium]
MDELLRRIKSPADLRELSYRQLEQLAAEIREALCRLLGHRSAHFASNLGVVELTLALHRVFDFQQDRLVWDTGHQSYPHKLVTGRYPLFHTIRSKGGLMGYPNPAESPFDLFLVGHSGTSVSTAVGLRVGDELVEGSSCARFSVAVVGDGAFGCGVVFEAMNHAAGMKKTRLIVVLNDNKMSIGPRVGGLAEYLDRLRMTHFYRGLKSEIQRILSHVPLFGDPVERFLEQARNALKAGLLGGMLFEELGFHYLGPVDGHNIRQLERYLRLAQQCDRPVLVHAVTKKGYGFKPAEDDPITFHAPAPFARRNGTEVVLKASDRLTYTQVARDTIYSIMAENPRVVVITAAMCEGNMLEPVRDHFPQRFFDVGICESHAVAFAAGLAKAGLIPIVDIYSTFLQRAYDQIFQEVALQPLPVVFCMDRAGVVGPDGPTHHGVFDIAYLRHLPQMVLMAPGDAAELNLAIRWAVASGRPVAIRYPKAAAENLSRRPAPFELGRAEVLREGPDGALVVYGALLPAAERACRRLEELGIHLTLVNARFAKPLDPRLVDLVDQMPFVVTVEEGCLQGGFGSALLEAANEAGVDSRNINRLGIPDQFVEHGERDELLADLGLTAEGICQRCLRLLERQKSLGSPGAKSAMAFSAEQPREIFCR